MVNNAIHRLNIFYIDSAVKFILTFISRKAMYPLESVIHPLNLWVRVCVTFPMPPLTSRVSWSIYSLITCTESLSCLRLVRKELNTEFVSGGKEWSRFLFSTVSRFSFECWTIAIHNLYKVPFTLLRLRRVFWGDYLHAENKNLVVTSLSHRITLEHRINAYRLICQFVSFCLLTIRTIHIYLRITYNP